MKILRIIAPREFEIEGDLKIGDFVECGDIIGIISYVYQEEPEILKYIGGLDKEEIGKFLPDISEARTLSRCYSLCTKELNEPLNSPKIGEKVRILNDDEIRKLHIRDGNIAIPYLPFLISKNVDLAKRVVKKLISLFPEEKDVLEIILLEIEYNKLKRVEI